MSCVATNGDSLLSLKTHVAGWECEGWFLYALVIIFTIFLQIVRNRIWAISGQAGREALHTSKGSEERWYYIRVLLFYTFLSTTLHIVNILLILGSNLGILLAVLIGNMAGTLYAYTRQPADKHRTSEELSDMIKKFMELNRKEKLDTDESDMLNKLNETKNLLKEFISDELPIAVPVDDVPEMRSLNFRIRR